MKDDDRTQHVRKIRDRARKSVGETSDVPALAADELLASLHDGVETLEGADEGVLGDALQAHGRDHVLAAVAHGASLRAAAAETRATDDERGGRILGGAQRFGVRTAAVFAVAAALLLFVVLKGGSERTVSLDVTWNTVAALEIPQRAGDWTASSMLTAEEGRPGWGAAMRGGVSTDDPALRRLAAVVLVDDAYGAATVIDADGWLLTASDLVAAAVQEAAWRGGSATVTVELVDVDGDGRATPLGDRRTARVMRHDPVRGLTLLRVEGLEEPLAGVIARMSRIPSEGEDLALVEAPRGDGEIARRGIMGTRWTDLRGRGGFTFEGTPYLAGMAGAPIARIDGEDSVRLVGIALDGDRNSMRAAGPDAIDALVVNWPDEAELYPPDPSSFASGGATSAEPWDASGRLDHPARIVHSEDRLGDRRTAIFASLEPPGARRDLSRPDSFGVGEWDVFVLLAPGDRRAIGVRGSGAVPTRIWVGVGEAPDETLVWELGAAGKWQVARAAGAAAIECTEAQKRLLASILGEE